MHGIVDKMGLDISELPDFTTVCARKHGEVQAIDATGFDRHSASRHYANRIDYTFR